MSKEIFVEFRKSYWLLRVYWNLKSILNMLSCCDSSEETAVFRSSVPRITWVNNHSSNVAYRLINHRSLLIHAFSKSRINSILVTEKLIQSDCLLRRIQLWLAIRSLLIRLVQYPWIEIADTINHSSRLRSLRFDIFVNIFIESFSSWENWT